MHHRRRRWRRRRTVLEAAVRFRQAIRSGEITRQEAARLLGFLILESLDFVPPLTGRSYARRCRSLEGLGLSARGGPASRGKVSPPVPIDLD